LAVKQINDAGGFVVNGKTYKLEPYYRDNRTDVNTASIAMTKITNPAKVIQFTGNSTLGGFLSEDSTKPGARCTTLSRPNLRSSSAAAALRRVS
jgi:hypothetical protein